jgi:hypothetical protein
MKNFPGLCILMILTVKAPAATWYVDGTAAGSHNGTSWANAWTSLSQVSSVGAGDTVYISGGASGNSKTYSVSDWKPAGGGTGSPITYQIGQDSAHNGTAIFSGSGTWFGGANNVVISGDAGDGAMHFSCAGYGTSANINGNSNLRISYVNLGNNLGDGIDGQSVTAFQLDHCYAYISSSSADHFFSVGFNGTTWDQNLIHDNTIYVPHQAGASGDGADAFQIGGNGYDLYNNKIVGYDVSNYTGGQHQDGWQSLTASYVKLYGNTFVDIGNYALFGDAYYGGFNHVWVYNNIFLIVGSAVYPGGAVFGTDGGYLGPSPCTFNDVIIANNLASGYPNDGGQPFSLNNVSPYATVFTGDAVVNNVIVNGGGISLSGNITSTLLGIVSLTAAQAGADFVSYTTTGGTNNDYHLKSVATLLIGQGVNESADFTSDRDGQPRPATGAWDIGPYQYASGGVSRTNPVIQVTPGSIVYGTVLGGTTVTNSFTIKNVGSGVLNGTASVGSPFSIVSGGNYSLNSNQSQTVAVVFSPTAASNFTQTVSCSGGGGTNVTVKGSATSPAAGPGSGIITEKVTANTTNLVTLQFTTNLAAPNWQTIAAFTGSTNLSFTNLPAVFFRGVCSNLTGSVTLTWPPSSAPSVKGYMVYYGLASHNYTSSVNAGKATTAIISNLSGNQVYYFAIDTYGVLGNASPYLNEISATPQVNTISFSLALGGP